MLFLWISRKPLTEYDMSDFAPSYSIMASPLILSTGYELFFSSDRQKQAVVVDVTQSSWKEVTSGVPQGSAIGPTLYFSTMIYKMTFYHPLASLLTIVSSIVRSCLIPILQQDLQKLSSWSTTWLMNFNVKKCGVMSITRKHQPRPFQYCLYNDVIPRVSEHKYLGVTVTSDLYAGKSTAKTSGTRPSKP